MAPHSSTLAWKSHGWRSLVGCSPWGHEESDTTERLHLHFSPSWMGEGNGNPLQCSCLGNLRGGEAWWAAVYGVTQIWTWLKWLSSNRMCILLLILIYISWKFVRTQDKSSFYICSKEKNNYYLSFMIGIQYYFLSCQYNVCVQLLSCVWLLATSWAVGH